MSVMPIAVRFDIFRTIIDYVLNRYVFSSREDSPICNFRAKGGEHTYEFYGRSASVSITYTDDCITYDVQEVSISLEPYRCVKSYKFNGSNRNTILMNFSADFENSLCKCEVD